MKKQVTAAAAIAALLSSSVLPSVTYAAESESQETKQSTTTTQSSDETKMTSDTSKTATTDSSKPKDETAQSEADKKMEDTTGSKDQDKTSDSDKKADSISTTTTKPAESKPSQTATSESKPSHSNKPSSSNSNGSHAAAKPSHQRPASSASQSSSSHHSSSAHSSSQVTPVKPRPSHSSSSHYQASRPQTVQSKPSQTAETTNDAVANALPVNPIFGTVDDVNETPIHITTNITGKKFVDFVGKYAAKIAEQNDLYASVMIAQACLESGFGSSSLSQAPYYNFFGIKGSYKGKSVTMATLEDGPGGMYSIQAGFRAYPSPEDSLKDYAKLLQQPMYEGAHKSHTKSYKDATKYLTGRYATDRNYAAKLNGIIKAYDLTKYDNYKGSDLKRINRIKEIENIYYTVHLGDVLSQIASAHDTSVEEIHKWNRDKIKNINLIFPNQKLIVGQKVTYKDVATDDDDQDKLADVKQGDFNLPLKPGTYTITSPFGNRGAEHHDGIDLATPLNSNVYAAKDGIVMATGYDPSAGNYIFIYHGDGIYTNYFHLNKVDVQLGDTVKAGHLIAKSGSTGNSTGPHLHFGISHRIWGDYIDPQHYLDF